MKIKLTLSLLFLTVFLFSQSDSTNRWAKKLDGFNIQPIIGLQLWSSYTLGGEKYNADIGQYELVADRLNFQLRRSRLGIKGQPYNLLKFNITTSLDLVGRDILSGTVGGGNNGASPSIRLWNAWLQYKINPQNDALHFTVGYFAPQIGRESITSAFRSTSMEKSWSQNYLRRHLTGIGPGRALGINLGGLLLKQAENLHLSYDVGVFNPVFHSYNGNSTGDKYAPLLVGRMAVHIGEPEFNNYTISHKVNYFGKRKGITLAVATARQGATDLFSQNTAFSIDLLLNWHNLNIDGEWTTIQRESAYKDNIARSFELTSNLGYLRTSYNLVLKNTMTLEPIVMFVWFNGPMDTVAQTDAIEVRFLSGEEKNWNIGINLYLNPNLKLSLHYTEQIGDAGDAGEGATNNNYFFQSGVGAIRRGDWFGLGIATTF